MKNKKQTKTKTERKEKDQERKSAVETCIVNVTRNFREDRAQFNVAIAELMKLTNHLLEVRDDDSKEHWEAVNILVRMLAPVAPHFAADAWELLGHTDDVHDQKWPTLETVSWYHDDVQSKRVSGSPLVIRVRGTRVVMKDTQDFSPEMSDEALVQVLRQQLGTKVKDLKHIVVQQKDGTKSVNFIP